MYTKLYKFTSLDVDDYGDKSQSPTEEIAKIHGFTLIMFFGT